MSEILTAEQVAFRRTSMLALHRDQLADSHEALRAALAEAEKECERLRHHLAVVLPMARGYAAAYPVGRNLEMVENASAVAGGVQEAQEPISGDRTTAPAESNPSGIYTEGSVADPDDDGHGSLNPAIDLGLPYNAHSEPTEEGIPLHAQVRLLGRAVTAEAAVAAAQAQVETMGSEVRVAFDAAFTLGTAYGIGTTGNNDESWAAARAQRLPSAAICDEFWAKWQSKRALSAAPTEMRGDADVDRVLAERRGK